LPHFTSQIVDLDQQEESEMSKVVRFRTLKHGDPPRFKVLPENLRKRSSRSRSASSTGSFPIMVLALVAIAALAVVGGFVG
jgi:nitrate reductase NapE component